jgi:hypothetical protein
MKAFSQDAFRGSVVRQNRKNRLAVLPFEHSEAGLLGLATDKHKHFNS